MIYETEVCIHLNDKKVDPTKIILSLRLALHIVTWKFPCRNYFTLQTSTQSPLNWLLVLYISFLRENLHWKNTYGTCTDFTIDSHTINKLIFAC